MSAIGLRQLEKRYQQGVTAVNGVDLTIRDGEFFALLGPSGCGKTTLLRTIAGLEHATAGGIQIGNADVTRMSPGERDVAMVFQDYALFPHMNVTQNVAYPLRIKKTKRDERERRAAEVGSELSLGELMNRRPAQLSGGQQQRAALARAIATHPEVFLLDEPLSNLDARLRLETRSFLKRLQQSLSVTTVFVTHDQAEALAMADRMAIMEDGNIRQVGTPKELFQWPQNTFVANFIGATPMNLLPAQVEGTTINVAGNRIPVPDEYVHAVSDTEDVTVGIRPEYLEFSPTLLEGGMQGKVVTIESLGVESLVTLDLGREGVGVVVGEEREPGLGDEVWVRPVRGRVLLYQGDTGDLIEPHGSRSHETARVPEAAE